MSRAQRRVAFGSALWRWLKQTRAGRWTVGVLSILFWLSLWYAAARALNKPLLLPTPTAVLVRLGTLLQQLDFWRATLTSLLRVLSGIVGGIVLSLLTAALTAASPLMHTLLQPLITVVKSTPVASFIILALLWLDRSILPALIALLMVFPVLWGNAHTGLTTVPMAYHELATVYRLPLARRIRRIYLPYTLPFFLSACRSSLGLAWKAGIAAEVLCLPVYSIGKNLSDSRISLETTDLFAWTVVVIVLSLCVERVAELLFSKLQRHAPDGERKEAEPS